MSLLLPSTSCTCTPPTLWLDLLVLAGTFVGRNLVPATLGNLVGGGFFVGCMYALALGSPGHAIQVGCDGCVGCKPDQAFQQDVKSRGKSKLAFLLLLNRGGSFSFLGDGQCLSLGRSLR